MVIARVVNGALQVLGRLKQRVHLADGLDSNNVLSEEAIERGLACLALFAERLQGFPADNVTIVGTHTLRQAVNAEVFLKRAAKVIPYPIEIIAGQEEARLIFMGVEHTQPEKGRKLVIDIGGGSTELVIGEDFEPLLAESRRMGCVSFAQLFFPGGEISKTTSAARGWRRRKIGNAGLAVPHSGLAVRAGRLGHHQGRPRSAGGDGEKTVSSPWIAWKCSPNRCCSSKASVR